MRTTVKATLFLFVIAGLGIAHLVAQSLVANAGPDQSGMFVGTTVNLNGTASVGATSYTWSFTKRPSGSTAALLNPTSATPSFVPDRGGAYTVRLVVGNGVTTASDTVVVTTGNRAPTASAGADVSVAVGRTAALNGTASTDPDLNRLTFLWTLVSRPAASVAALTKATSSKPSLFLDRPGSYVVRLVVKDGTLLSAPDEVVVTTSNTLPVAAAGPDRQVVIGAVVTLDATGSSDVDEDTLTYTWTLSRPGGSSAVLDDPTSPLPSFLPNLAGSYTATLRVSDGVATKTDSVVITTNANRAPVARTRADDRSLLLGQAIQLDGAGTVDANGQLLTSLWTVTRRPGGSTAALVGAGTPRPTFTADRAGSYTFSLSATDTGGLAGTDTQIYGTALPQADAGPDQVVTVGSDVALDGSRSSHLNGTLAFGWALISMPDGSTAVLDNPADPQPHFAADLDGTYVAQLIVFDGARLSLADTVAVTTGANLPPRVDLGSDRLVATNTLTTIDALATDPNLDPLTYAWALLGRPVGSAAALSGAAGASVQITPDVAGDYVVQLVGTDPGGLSSVGTLVLTTANTEPTVSAGVDRLVASGAMVELDAMSDDPDGGALTYRWSVLTKPAGSTASLNDPAAQAPSFTADVDGVYVLQVVVRDPAGLQAVDAVVLRSGAGGAPPVADAGSPETVAPGTLVQLDGTASSDPEGEPLMYAWQIVSKPGGSAAALSDPASSQPTLTVDVAGAYVFELVVNDGVQDSEPSQVTIAVNGPPVAEAGADQAVDTGSPVTLNGSASTDPEGQPLTYTWTVALKPGGSSAAPTPPGSATPTFTPDVAGVYVLQLVVNDGFSDSLADTVAVTTRRAPSISPTSVSIAPGNSSTVTVSVPYATGNALELQLSSSNTGVATVPATVTIPANQTSATFDITAGNTNGGAIVKATAQGVGTGETSVAVGARLARWIQDASGAWETPSNWSDNAVPGAGDVVVIDRPAGNFVITIGAPTAAVASLLSRESLNVFSTLTVDGAAAFDGAVNLSATLAGSGSALLNAPLTWTSGVVSLAGGLEVLAGQTLTMFPSNGVGRALVNSSLTNHGTVAMGTSGNALVLQGAAAVLNAADGVWDVGDGTFTSAGTGALTVTNAGLLRKTSGTGLLLLGGYVAYTNTGTIEVQSGTAQATGDGANATLANAGQLKLSAGTAFSLHAVTLNAGTSFAGAGTLTMNGTTTVNADVAVTLPTTLTGTVTGAGTLRMAAPLTWTSGVVSLGGGLEVLAGQTLTFPNNGTGRSLTTGTSLRNFGTVSWFGSGALVYVGGNIAVRNEVGGLWTYDAGTFGILASGSPSPLGSFSFLNAGAMQGAGALSTFVTVGSQSGFSSPGTTAGIHFDFVP